jgi:hypothetical protein
VLAQRVLTEAPDTNRRIERAFELVLARAPREGEAKPLRTMLAYAQDRFRTKPADATALLTQGEAPRPAAVDPAELAAWSTVTSMILNLDAAVTKE